MNNPLIGMRLVPIAFLLYILGSCNDKHDRPDVSKVQAHVEIQRFDRDFFSLDTNHLSTSLESLYKKYPSFLPLYFEFLSPVNFIVHQNRKSYSEAVLEYFRNMKSLEDSVQKKFPEKEIEK